MKIAVTGANGHVGANLTRSLLDLGHTVRVLLFHDSQSLQGLPVERVRGDLADHAALQLLCSGVDVVFHLAAQISINGQENLLNKVNVEGTRNLLDIAKRSNVKKFIHFSSIHALSHAPFDQPMDESNPIIDESQFWYERTKAEGQRLALAMADGRMEVVILNPTAIIGPNDFKPSRMGLVLIKLYDRSLPALVPGGYNWVDVRDVVDGAIHAIEKGRNGQNYILAGSWVSVSDLARLVETTTGRKSSRIVLPTWVARLGVPFMKAYAGLKHEHPLYTNESLDILRLSNHRISSSKAANELGFRSRPLEDTVRDTLAWFEQNGYLKPLQ